MKKNIINTLFAILIISVLFLSCTKEITTKEKKDLYEDLRYNDFIFLLLEQTCNNATKVSDIYGYNKLNPVYEYDTMYSATDFPKKLKLTYREPGINGTIELVFYSFWTDTTQVKIDIGFQDLVYYGQEVVGDVEIVKKYRNEFDSIHTYVDDEQNTVHDSIFYKAPIFDVKATRLFFIDALYNISRYSSEREFFWDEGYLDGIITKTDIFKITGISSGINDNGYTYSTNITTPLVKNDCIWFPTGVIEIVSQEEGDYSIEFGNGLCDDEAYIKFGYSYNYFTLQ